GDDAVARGDMRIVHQRAILPAVAARGVQAEQRRTLPRLLDIEPVRPAEQVEMHVAAGDGFETRAHAATPFPRSFASASWKYRRCAMKTLRSPSVFSIRRRTIAIRSFDPGGGRSRENFSHSASGARSAKDQDGITKGPRVTEAMRPSTIAINQAASPTSSRN